MKIMITLLKSYLVLLFYLVNLCEHDLAVLDLEDAHLGDDHVYTALACQGQGAVGQDLVGSTLP